MNLSLFSGVTEAFYSLDPYTVMSTLEQLGFHPTGEYLQLNSYENRVFEIVLEKASWPEGDRLIAKFYRPGRWTSEAIKDEHRFLIELQNAGISAVAPLGLNHGDTLFEHQGMQVCLFPKVIGRMPQEFLGDQLKQVGRILAHLHNTGAQSSAESRPTMHPNFYGWSSLDFLLDKWVAPEVTHRYEKAAEAIFEDLEDKLEDTTIIRIHGDCHKGNLLFDDRQFFFVDFDDFCNGPAAQDFWMLFSGDDNRKEQEQILEGYRELRNFDETEASLYEPLRGMRIVNYASWIAHRWDEPNFPRLFPEFNTYTYWAEECEALEKIAWRL